MKKIYSIITCLAVALSLFTSCSDEEKINTGSAQVAFAQSELEVKESKGIFYVPITVSGEQNGTIKLSVSVSSNDADCKEDVNYIITSKNLIIPENTKEVAIEIKAIDDRIINSDRHFSLHIENANGATIGGNKTANITLLDNDDIPYERMGGTWVVSATNILSESGNDPISWETKLTIVEDESDPSYGSVITSAPWAIFTGETELSDAEKLFYLTHQMIFHHNESSGKTTVEMKMGSYMASNLNFGMQPIFNDKGEKIGESDCYNASIRSATIGMAGLVYSGTITGTVNETFDEITFNNQIWEIIFNTAGAPFQYYGGFDNITFKLKK